MQTLGLSVRSGRFARLRYHRAIIEKGGETDEGLFVPDCGRASGGVSGLGARRRGRTLRRTFGPSWHWFEPLCSCCAGLHNAKWQICCAAHANEPEQHDARQLRDARKLKPLTLKPAQLRPIDTINQVRLRVCNPTHRLSSRMRPAQCQETGKHYPSSKDELIGSGGKAGTRHLQVMHG